ncbi:unnamed protein product [Protopolystoma xenopodis]|uniref:Uncharacterized protein n=1 Tax=Protopolystoma xenopodis TaxID=117903 RepID=A0A448WVX0_9PLAT|nr:unnamed protein product [Protopolystoma xenopodis]
MTTRRHSCRTQTVVSLHVRPMLSKRTNGICSSFVVSACLSRWQPHERVVLLFEARRCRASAICTRNNRICGRECDAALETRQAPVGVQDAVRTRVNSRLASFPGSSSQAHTIVCFALSRPIPHVFEPLT